MNLSRELTKTLSLTKRQSKFSMKQERPAYLDDYGFGWSKISPSLGERCVTPYRFFGGVSRDPIWGVFLLLRFVASVNDWTNAHLNYLLVIVNMFLYFPSINILGIPRLRRFLLPVSTYHKGRMRVSIRRELN
jgi:hypothetical protein